MDLNNFNFRRWFITIFFTVLAIAAYVVGYQVTEIDPVKLFTSMRKSQNILSDLIHPELFTRETENTTFDIVFPVPCGSAEPTQLPSTGPQIVPDVQCANKGDVITLKGTNLPPNNDVKIQWLLPSGNALFSKLATTGRRPVSSWNITTPSE